MPVELIIYAVVAAGLVFWLRNILGTEDDDAENPIRLHDQNVPADAEKPIFKPEDIITALSDKSGVMAIDNKTAEMGLIEIVKADKEFDIYAFLQAAQDAFVIIVEAFADGDREALKDLLSPEVFKVFNSVISERTTRGEKHETEIHAVKKANVIDAKLDKKMAYITVRFIADETRAAYDSAGELISGHPEKTTEMHDIWVFGREVRSRDPRWFLYETRSDFDGDNETIPNTDQ